MDASDVDVSHMAALARRLLALALLLSGSACAAAGSARQGAEAPAAPRSRFLLHAGGRELDDDFFYDPVEKPIALGLEYARSFEPEARAGLGLELAGFLAGETDDSLGPDITATFLEADLGLRLRWSAGRVELFAGGGPMFVLADIDIESGPSDDDASAGAYFHLGALFDVSRDLALGLDARAGSGTDISFDGFADTDADYAQVTVILGFRG
jgi:hypothetical protein